MGLGPPTSLKLRQCSLYQMLTLMPALRSSSRVGLTLSCRRSSTPVRHSSSMSRSSDSTTLCTRALRSCRLSLAWWYRDCQHHQHCTSSTFSLHDYVHACFLSFNNGSHDGLLYLSSTTPHFSEVLNNEQILSSAICMIPTPPPS